MPLSLAAPTDEERAWLTRGFVGYLAAPGYAEMFIDAGFEDLVAFARTRPHPKQLLERVPPELIEQVGLIGTESQVRARIAAYETVGISEVCLVPPAPEWPSAVGTLEALAPG